MGRKRKSAGLEIYVGKSKVGIYVQSANGSSSFCYDPNWLSNKAAFPISLSMPLSDRTWSGAHCLSFFEGLLPDNRAIREKIAAREHAESANVFDLLAAIGRDCVGALQFIPEGQDPGDPTKMIYRLLRYKEIAKRIASLRENPLGIQYDEDFRISIAGVQEKTAFLWVDNHWQLPLHHTPTSHIFKPAIKEGPNGADFSDTPWNEWLCLNICHELGLETAQTKVAFFEDKPVIVIERFDRVWQGNFTKLLKKGAP